MSSIILVYEKDAALRDKLSKWFESECFTLLICYSYEKLISELQKNLNNYLIIVSHKNNKSELTSLNGNLSFVYYENQVVEQNILLSQIKDALRLQLRKQKSGGSNFLDIIILGSSTGGFPIVQQILQDVKLNQSIVIICQHVNKDMTEQLVKSVQMKTLSPVKSVTSQLECEKGKIYLLSGGIDFELNEKYGKLYLVPAVDNTSTYHPSVNLIGKSLALLNGYSRGIIILSGLGADGSSALPELKSQEVIIVAQDPTTSVAPGMPQSAIQTGTVNHIFKPTEITQFIKRSAA